MSTIAFALTDADIVRCFPVMHQLRPHLLAEQFVSLIRAQQAQGFHLAFLQQQETIVTVAGFRIHHLLATGNTLYVDDLVTDQNSRSQGHGDRMLHWLIDHARHVGCTHFSLDSGTHRLDAHAFYFRHRMRISAFHFQLPLV